MEDESQPIGPAIDEAILSRFPEALAQYEELKEELRRLMAEERQHYKNAVRYLKKRKAGTEQYAELRAERETELRRIEEEFRQKVWGLVDGLIPDRKSR